MMDVIADLVRRGIISPDAAQTFAKRLQSLSGNLQGSVDDRRANPDSGYLHMLAGNQRLRFITRSILGLDPPGGEKGWYDIVDPPPQTAGKLEKDAGINDIGKHLARHYYDMAPDDGKPLNWGYGSKE